LEYGWKLCQKLHEPKIRILQLTSDFAVSIILRYLDVINIARHKKYLVSLLHRLLHCCRIGTMLSCRPIVPRDSPDLDCHPGTKSREASGDAGPYVRVGTVRLPVSFADSEFQLLKAIGVDRGLLSLHLLDEFHGPHRVAELHGLHRGRSYQPNSRSWYPVTPNQPLKYALSAGADAHMIATFVSTAVATQEPKACQEMSYVGEGLILV
jgi:hypothetical protein